MQEQSINKTEMQKNKGLDLFRRGRWREASETLAGCLERLRPDAVIPACLGICYLRLGEYDRALGFFEKLQSPIPAVAGLNWAAIYCRSRDYDMALRVLARVNRKTAPGKASGKENSLKEGHEDSLEISKEALEIACCIVFAEIVSVISGARDIKPLKPPGRNRLLKLITPGILIMLRILDLSGRIADKVGLPNSRTILRLVDGFRGQCWVYGLPVKPEFLEGKIHLHDIKSFEISKNIYRDIFLAYLDYWTASQQDIYDLILATVKPGDAHALYCIIRDRQPVTVLEIGTFIGFSTCIMARALKDNGRGVIYCIDPNMKHLSVNKPLLHAEKMLKILQLDDYAELHEGFFSDPVGDIAPAIPRLGRKISEIAPPIDMAFIDGDHATTAVLQDFMLLLPYLSEKATVVFHDIHGWPTVRQGILTLFHDNALREQMQYFEFIPSGYDGVAMIEIHKKKDHRTYSHAEDQNR